MTVTVKDIRQAVKILGVSGMPVCVHSSLRSFGSIAHGAETIVAGFLAEGCTVLVPTFSDAAYAIAPPDLQEMRPPRNGIDYTQLSSRVYMGKNEVYTPASRELNITMGLIPKYIVEHPQRVRGNHPLNSFAALGPLAETLIDGQDPLNVYAPLHTLTLMHGSIILMGVGLERMTFLHYAEQVAGRELFRRCANGPDYQPMLVAVGSCSEGFGRLEPALASAQRKLRVGQSLWQVYAAGEALQLAVGAIREQPDITHCADQECVRCNDAIKGGPLLEV
ncbi:AAC(3) family N-acetyltransferase [Dictyobacter formicarum]|uniref:Aminoglycoside N(3)-acetyltransferase n=1 Tax=Dictyobacter formicarum TaxID=2778368 RepID=A0ABQ3VX42_9CHLR|nr:AAC(3) family N-acetyltransferase [Dictyobacter formicarum]GHO89943.1 AAC(3) family N-acetyltransferase [Dictyobacter formicarum]